MRQANIEKEEEEEEERGGGEREPPASSHRVAVIPEAAHLGEEGAERENPLAERERREGIDSTPSPEPDPSAVSASPPPASQHPLPSAKRFSVHLTAASESAEAYEYYVDLETGQSTWVLPEDATVVQLVPIVAAPMELDV